MHAAGAILSVTGAAFSLGAAVWLLVGFDPENPRYSDEGPLYPGPQHSVVVGHLLADQRWTAAVAVVGATLQLAGIALLV